MPISLNGRFSLPVQRWVVLGLALVVVVSAIGSLRVGSWAEAATSSGDRAIFEPLPPARILDTRLLSNAVGPGESRSLQVTGAGGVPSDATAVVLNVTAFSPTAAGWLTLYPADAALPIASNVNFSAGQTVPNSVTVRLGSVGASAGQIKIYNSAGQTNVIVDIGGYFRGHDHDDRYYTKAQTQARIAADSLTCPAGQFLANVAADGKPTCGASNPLQVATLHWYQAAQGNNFGVGTRPSGMAFDGSNMWVSNAGSDTVIKLRADDGANLGTFAVGSNPRGVAFDGANIWVSNYVSNNLTKLRASDGANLGTFTAGTGPIGLAYDGANMWVANDGSGTATKLRATDGVTLGTFPVGSTTVGPVGVAFDGANMWVTNGNGNSVTKLRASDGANLGTFATGTSPYGVAFDGTSIWVVNSGSANVTKLQASDGSSLGTFPVATDPSGVAFDGSNMWVTSYLSGSNVTKLRAGDGANLGTFTAGTNPFPVAFDGNNIWVGNNGGSNVTKL